MRIIAGKYRSRIIKMPEGAAGIRPTKDRLREALFNIISGSIPGAAALDAFAGSGAFGIEALSRGAKKIVFIDKEKRCVRTIKDNLKMLDISNGNTAVWKMDAFKAFVMLERKKEKFDVIFLDPPYYKDMAKKSLIILNRHDILKPNCIIIAEHYKKDILPGGLHNITSYRTACYGDIFLTFYKAKR
ncbi:MAG: 16S rRNA (guanine(966)-N(2))-methyltransferase RsmD [Candidatus Omnitrophota bacterium]|nr:16S rRNA (guanine(966)-N(2))-methyltransferase RsmD [Candidatus Omnitrophota bacterium]